MQVTEVVPYPAGPPVPPGPLDRLIPGDLNGFSTSYTNTNGVIHFRIAAVNGAASVPTIAITVDGAPVTFIAQDTVAAVGAALAWAGYITGVTPGAHTIAITVTGTVGNAALRVGELVSQTGIGTVATSVQGSPQYYIEINNIAVGAPGTSQMGSIYTFTNAAAGPIYLSYPDTEQWNTEQTGMAARFGTGASPSGEATPGLFVAYTFNGANYNAAGIVYEIRGAVLP